MPTLANKIKLNIIKKSTHKYGQLAIFLTFVVRSPILFILSKKLH